MGGRHSTAPARRRRRRVQAAVPGAQLRRAAAWLRWLAKPRASIRLASALAAATVVAATGCATSDRKSSATDAIPAPLLAEARPIGQGPDFHRKATGPVIGPCRRSLDPRQGAHVELFAHDRVVIIPAAIGTRPPRTLEAGRIATAGCYGDLVTIEPTGVVLIRPGETRTLKDLFRSWGQPLSQTQLGPFPAPANTVVAAYVNGRPWHSPPGTIPLTRHAEIVLEVGPQVPPHSTYTFPPGT